MVETLVQKASLFTSLTFGMAVVTFGLVPTAGLASRGLSVAASGVPLAR